MQGLLVPVNYNRSLLSRGNVLQQTWSGTDLSVANGGTGVSTFTSSQLLYGNGTAALSSVATTTLSLGLGLSHSGTLGALVGGSAGTLTIATSSLFAGTTGLFPYFSGTNELTATSSLFIAASGNIGVGSTTPAYKFSVGDYGSHFAVNSSGMIRLYRNRDFTAITEL